MWDKLEKEIAVEKELIDRLLEVHRSLCAKNLSEKPIAQ